MASQVPHTLESSDLQMSWAGSRQRRKHVLHLLGLPLMAQDTTCPHIPGREILWGSVGSLGEVREENIWRSCSQVQKAFQIFFFCALVHKDCINTPYTNGRLNIVIRKTLFQMYVCNFNWLSYNMKLAHCLILYGKNSQPYSKLMPAVVRGKIFRGQN